MKAETAANMNDSRPTQPFPNMQTVNSARLHICYTDKLSHRVQDCSSHRIQQYSLWNKIFHMFISSVVFK